MNQPQKFYKSLLNGRARGDQTLRTNPPRPPKDDKKTMIEILKLAKKSKEESDRSRYGSASHLLARAIKLTKTLDEHDADLLAELSRDKHVVDKKIERLKRRSARTSATSMSLQAP